MPVMACRSDCVRPHGCPAVDGSLYGVIPGKVYKRGHCKLISYCAEIRERLGEAVLVDSE
jgi:hypothetical protein